MNQVECSRCDWEGLEDSLVADGMKLFYAKDDELEGIPYDRCPDCGEVIESI